MSPAARVVCAPMPASVLLVEDEVVLRALLAEEFRSAGLAVTEAANADEAWAYLISGAAVDLLFSDVSMPGSMDGIALTNRVRETFPAIKIVITSGNLGPRDISVFDGFVQKPFSFGHAVRVASDTLGLAPPDQV